MSHNRPYLDFRGPFYPPNFSTPYGPHYGHNWQSISPPQSGYPRMWGPNDNYYRHQYSGVPNDHYHRCCLSTQNAGGCQNMENKDKSTENVVIDDVTNELADIETLKTSIADSDRKLKETKLDLLDNNERQAIKFIEALEKNLKQMADQIKVQCKRFLGKDDILKQLLITADQVYNALVKTNNLKDWVRDRTILQKSKISEDLEESYGVSAINTKLWTEMPDFWALNLSLFDNISIDLENIPKTTEDKSVGIDAKEMPKTEEIDIKTANLSLIEEEIKVNEMTEKGDHLIDLKEKDLKESTIGKTFGSDRFPVIQLPYNMKGWPKDQKPSNSKVLVDSQPMVNHLTPDIMNDNDLNVINNGSALLYPQKPTTRVENQMNGFDTIPVNEKAFNGTAVNRMPVNGKATNGMGVNGTAINGMTGCGMFENESLISLNSNSTNDEIMKSSPEKNGSTATLVSASTDCLKANTTPQQKLIEKLKAIHPKMSEKELTEAIKKTKNLFIEFGQTKGFTGMKMRDIIDAVSAFLISDSESDSKTNTPSKKGTVGRPNTQNCVLCSNGMASADAMSLSCKHTFHFSCLQKWAQTNNRCPQCAELF